ncbi:class I mannose-6-phosphate isomerase [Herbiconiux sp. CPCC 205763]|uniref:Class I mannose-6-phosphate isomerase n=1 Tax=Herbiconiux aconitum TaxID=2970913 RepID=A0ABT2GVB2_9MICO|nr:class I mannose-6-phosphate isomerase [Herbiconiux aconitum]MCS5720081.1 class I mannose-6-phosphate isomerase [Herbiconiux aconitum]
MRPAFLAPNLIDHFYRGGDRIARLRGIEQTSDHQPEEWLAATVSRAGQSDIGLARTDGGELLRDLVAHDPAGWVGADHADAANASDTGILVKLLDARQRLPVHVHPARAFAATHLDCPYGKTEAWFVLDAEPGSAVHLGWKEAVDRDELDRRRDAQDSEWMLSRMNRIEVSRGMGVVVPAGTVHAIDAGIFVAEVQEPTDFSIVLEWSITTSTREESHLGLGFDEVMPAVSTAALGPEALAGLITRSDLDGRSDRAESMLAPAADPYFRVLHAAPGSRGVPIAAGYSVVLVLAGDGVLAGDEEIPVHSGQALAVPAGFGAWEVVGPTSVLIATPGVGWPRSLAEGVVT